MLANLKSRCPHCKAALRVDESLIGKRVVCPACKRPFEVSSVQASSTSLDQSPIASETIALDSTKTTDRLAGNTSSTSTSAPPPTGRLGRFELQELLGQGAFGRVYKAYDPQLDRFVALKVPTFGPHDKQKIQRFIAEAKAAARLRHPSIVPTYESGQIDGQYYIVAQFVDGKPLSRWIKENRRAAKEPQAAEADAEVTDVSTPTTDEVRVIENKPPDFRQAAQWVRQLADALGYAHGEGIVHRDIKPDNVMLDEKGVPQIMDFGLAKRVNEDAAMTTDGSILGTPAYMAPEQAQGKLAEVGPHSDQYSLGVLFYELLTGRKPFEGSPHSVIAAVIAHEPPAIRSLCPTAPADLEAICQKAMSKEAGQRYGSCAAFASDLAQWLSGEAVSARPLRSHERFLRWARRNPTVAGLGASVVGVATIALIIVSAALWSSTVAANKARIALANEQREREKAAASERDRTQALEEATLAQQRAEEEAKNAQAERAKADEERKAKEKSNEQLREKVVESEKATLAAQKAKREAATQAEYAKKSAAEAAQAGRKSAEQARENSMKLVQSYWNQANTLLAQGNYGTGISYLARALEQLPDTQRTDSFTWNETLRMAIGAELAGQPAIVSREDRVRQVVGFWETDPPLQVANVPKPPANRTAPVNTSPYPRLIDAEGNIDGENKKLILDEVPIACVPVPANYRSSTYHTLGFTPAGNNKDMKLPSPVSLINNQASGGGYLIVYRERPAQLLEIINTDPRSEPVIRPSSFVTSSTVVRAFARATLFTGPPNQYTKSPSTMELLVTVLEANGRSSVRVDRWDVQTATTPETITQGKLTFQSGKAMTTTTSEHDSDSMSLPEAARKACLGSVMSQVVTASERRVAVWDLRTKAVLGEFPVQEPTVDLACWPARNLQVVVGEKSVHLLSYPDLKPLQRYQTNDVIKSALLSPTGQSLILADDQGRITALDSTTLKALAQPSVLPAPFHMFAFRRGGDLAVLGGKTLRHWRLPLGQELVLPQAEAAPLAHDRSAALATATAISGTASWMITSHGKRLSAWAPYRAPDPTDTAPDTRLSGQLDLPLPISAIAAHPTDQLFAASTTNAIYLYRPGSGKQTGRWVQDSSPLRDEGDARVTLLAFSPDGSRLVNGNDRGAFRLWDVKRRRTLATWDCPGSTARAVAFSSNGRLIAASSFDSVVLFDTKSNEALPQTISVGSPVKSLALNQTGNRLLVGSEERTAVLFNAATGEAIGQPIRHAGPVNAVSFQSAGKFALSIGGGGVQFIHIETGLPAGAFMREVEDTRNAAIAVGGKHVVLAGRIYQLPSPLEGSPAEVKSVVESQIGARLDQDGALAWLEDR